MARKRMKGWELRGPLAATERFASAHTKSEARAIFKARLNAKGVGGARLPIQWSVTQVQGV